MSASEEMMNLSVNGNSQVPPGFRFHPTEEELLHYYLRKKVIYQKVDLDVIRDVDLNKLEPWDIQEKCRIGSGPQNDWYFFSHKDKKYPTGTRTNRATMMGFWKATGRDKVIHSCHRRIGMRKTLVFYKGRAPHGQKSDWIMHEYRLDDSTIAETMNSSIGNSEDGGWVVCRVFRKKNYQKSTGNYSIRATPEEDDDRPNNDAGNVLDQMLMYLGRSCKQEDEISYPKSYETPRFEYEYLPRLDESPSAIVLVEESKKNCFESDWAALDRLVASQLNGEGAGSFGLNCSSRDRNDDAVGFSEEENRGYSDLWSFNRSDSSSSSSQHPFSHFSV